jgi:hypothetical protein
MSHDHTTDHRTLARVVGALFVLASVSAVIGGSLIEPITEDGADLAGLSTQVTTGALLEAVLALSVIAIAVLLFPVLRRQHEGLALGYAALRTVEGAFVLLATASALVAVDLAGSAADAAVVDPALAARDWSYFLGTMLVFSVSAVVLNALLYPARLVPRWLAAWGLIGGLLLLTRTVLELYGVESSLGVQFVWAAPIALQEMVFAVWLFVRGFDTTHLAGRSRVATPAMPPEFRRPVGV